MYKKVIITQLDRLTRHLWNTNTCKVRAELQIDYLLGPEGEVFIFDINSGASGNISYSSMYLGSKFLAYERDFHNILADKAYSVFYTCAFGPYENERAIVEKIRPVIKQGKEFLSPPLGGRSPSNAVVRNDPRACVVVRSGVVDNKKQGEIKASEPFAVHLQQKNPELNVLNGAPLFSLAVQSKLIFHAINEVFGQQIPGQWYQIIEVNALVRDPNAFTDFKHRLPDSESGYILKAAQVNSCKDVFIMMDREELLLNLQEIKQESSENEVYFIIQPFYQNHAQGNSVGGIYRAIVLINHDQINHQINYDIVHHCRMQHKNSTSKNSLGNGAMYIELTAEENHNLLNELQRRYSRTFEFMLNTNKRAELDYWLKSLPRIKQKMLTQYLASLAINPAFPLLFDETKSQQWQQYLQMILPIWAEHMLDLLRVYIRTRQKDALRQCCKDVRDFLKGVDEEDHPLKLKQKISACLLIVDMAFLCVGQKLCEPLLVEIRGVLEGDTSIGLAIKEKFIAVVDLFKKTKSQEFMCSWWLQQAPFFYIWLCEN